MNKILLALLLVACCSVSFAQEKQERILYIVDSIPIINEPKDEEQLTEADIYNAEVITDEKKINALGHFFTDKIILLTTKAYAARPDALKALPRRKLMLKKDEALYVKGAMKPYSGKFIDYYMNGNIKAEGTLLYGLLNGTTTAYYVNGNKRYFMNHQADIGYGPTEDYFINGKLKARGKYRNGEEDGIWQEFYSTGKLKSEVNFSLSKKELPKESVTFYELLSKAEELIKKNEYKSLIKKMDEAVLLNAEYADVYFYRGNAKFNLFDFDSAIADFDKAIELEPLYMEALSSRAFARLRKYEFKDSKTISKTKEVTVMVAKDNVEVPKEEQDKICADLKLGYELGDRKPMIAEVMKRYCGNP
ncbi:tetratricopeptide repeat protein [Pedobacter heparinus]|uniref:tetratricopeptide repeat protein n=1 Tax=Pedobacter heparinus TaxID=984 RepID=UPI00292E129C|nr:tetratricopeptide repeat protein [Pedobacter heparinus]